MLVLTLMLVLVLMLHVVAVVVVGAAAATIVARAPRPLALTHRYRLTIEHQGEVFACSSPPSSQLSSQHPYISLPLIACFGSPTSFSPLLTVEHGNGNGNRALKAEVEKEAAMPTYTPEQLGLTPLKKRDKVRQGEKLVVCSGSQIGLEGEVLSVSHGVLQYMMTRLWY